MLASSWYQDSGHTQEALVSFSFSHFSKDGNFDKQNMWYMFLQTKDTS